MQVLFPKSRSGGVTGFTLVEVMVAVAVIAVLVSLIVPAVHAARESARRSQCKGNLRDLAQACRQHASHHGYLPFSGVNASYVGDADLGYRSPQTGGWLYNILPFIEQVNLHQMGAGLAEAAKNVQHGVRATTALAVYTCPGRGSPLFAGVKPTIVNATMPAGASYARSDYGGCGSESGEFGLGAMQRNDQLHAGYTHELVHIRDGLSNVFLCGERYLAPEQYFPSSDSVICNNAGWSVGVEGDVYSSVLTGGLGSAPNPPVRDTPGLNRCANDERFASGFGGPHAVVIMAMCDGVVRDVSFDVDPVLFGQLGTINDGGAVDQLDTH